MADIYSEESLDAGIDRQLDAFRGESTETGRLGRGDQAGKAARTWH